jgi:hypothetical protein
MASGAADLAADIRSRLQERPVIRRKPSALARWCGKTRLSVGFLREVDEELAKSGIHASRILADPSTLRSQTVVFSLAPLAPPEVAFGCERQLVDLVVASLGHVPPLHSLKLKRRESRLPSGRRIDLLCEVLDRSQSGALVAVELKRGRAGGAAVGQLAEYLGELAGTSVARGRKVRGILLAKDFSEGVHGVVGDRPIQCFRYKMAFEPAVQQMGVSRGAAALSAAGFGVNGSL